MNFDPSRLYASLLNTGLQQKDPPLYQVVHDLIGTVAGINNQTNTIISGGGTPGPRGLQGLQGIPGADGDSFDDSFISSNNNPTQGFTQGSVIFAGLSGVLAQDNPQFFWDNTNFRLGIGGAPGPYTLYVQSKAGAAGSVFERQFAGGAGIGSAAALRFIPSSGVVTANDGISLLFQATDDALVLHSYSAIATVFRNITGAAYEGEFQFFLVHKGATNTQYLHVKATDAGGIFAGNVLAPLTFDLALGGNLTESIRIIGATNQVVVGASTTPNAASYKFNVTGGFMALNHTTARFDISSTTTNNAAFFDFTNGGGTSYIGVENNVGNALVGGGGLAFATVIASANAIQFAPNGGAVSVTIDTTGALKQTKKTTLYNNIATIGQGLVSIYGIDNRTGLTGVDGAAITLYTTIAANNIFRVSADIFATAAVTGTATYTISWTENGTAQTMVVTATAINTLGTASNLIRPDNATAIKSQLTGVFTGTFTVVGLVEQVA